MIRQQLSRVHCRHGAWRAQRYVVFCLNARARVTVMTTSWTKESNFYKIKPLLIGQLQRKVYHRVCQSLICSSEKSEPHLFPYSRVVVHFVACCGYNVDRCSFAPKDGVSRQKTRPNVFLPILQKYSYSIWINQSSEKELWHSVLYHNNENAFNGVWFVVNSCKC